MLGMGAGAAGQRSMVQLLDAALRQAVAVGPVGAGPGPAENIPVGPGVAAARAGGAPKSLGGRIGSGMQSMLGPVGEAVAAAAATKGQAGTTAAAPETAAAGNGRMDEGARCIVELQVCAREVRPRPPRALPILSRPLMFDCLVTA